MCEPRHPRRRAKRLGNSMSTAGVALLRRSCRPCLRQQLVATYATTSDVATGSRGFPNATQPSTPGLYDGHTPLSPLQRAAVAVGSAVGALAYPERADLVAALGCVRAPLAVVSPSLPRHACLPFLTPPACLSETTGHAALAAMRDRMAADASGAQLLQERPRVTDSTLQACWELPEDTFGGAYARFMGVRNFVPRDRPPVRFVDDEELAYVAARCVVSFVRACAVLSSPKSCAMP
jgi:hypothetical protein